VTARAVLARRRNPSRLRQSAKGKEASDQIVESSSARMWSLLVAVERYLDGGSLPSTARAAAFQLYDPNSPRVVTQPPSGIVGAACEPMS
jgi:hypothetical protein